MNASISKNPECNCALPVAGIIPFSATDWPGNITVTVFTQGCPLRCVYCHNASLQSFTPGAHSFNEALSIAVQRKALIDGMVISGGEPTAVAGLADAIASAHHYGLPVGLHTCGYAPKRIAALLKSPDTTPDWVGLDIKALPEHMPEITGCAPSVSARVWESLRLLNQAHIGLQVRTTLWRGSVIEQHLDQLRERIRAYGHTLVVQQARNARGEPLVP